MPTKSQPRTEIVAGKIRKARDAAGLTNRSLARSTGIERRAIVRWTNGQNEPSPANLERIARATGKPLDFFRADEDDDEEVDMLRQTADGFIHALMQELRSVTRGRSEERRS